MAKGKHAAAATRRADAAHTHDTIARLTRDNQALVKQLANLREQHADELAAVRAVNKTLRVDLDTTTSPALRALEDQYRAMRDKVAAAEAAVEEGLDAQMAILGWIEDQVYALGGSKADALQLFLFVTGHDVEHSVPTKLQPAFDSAKKVLGTLNAPDPADYRLVLATGN